MLLLLLLPVPKPPSGLPGHFDKLVHFALFLGFATIYRLDRQPGIARVLLVSAGLAGGIELIQALLPYRSADWRDAVIGWAGALVGAVVVGIVKRRVT
ncbi:MAG: VanZ family protein [Gemmatimonadales bacterium]